MDSRDYVQMRRERRRRAGLKEESVQQQPIGSFERFTKVGEHSDWPIGSELLEEGRAFCHHRCCLITRCSTPAYSILISLI